MTSTRPASSQKASGGWFPDVNRAVTRSLEDTIVEVCEAVNDGVDHLQSRITPERVGRALWTTAKVYADTAEAGVQFAQELLGPSCPSFSSTCSRPNAESQSATEEPGSTAGGRPVGPCLGSAQPDARTRIHDGPLPASARWKANNGNELVRNFVRKQKRYELSDDECAQRQMRTTGETSSQRYYKSSPKAASDFGFSISACGLFGYPQEKESHIESTFASELSSSDSFSSRPVSSSTPAGPRSSGVAVRPKALVGLSAPVSRKPSQSLATMQSQDSNPEPPPNPQVGWYLGLPVRQPNKTPTEVRQQLTARRVPVPLGKKSRPHALIPAEISPNIATAMKNLYGRSSFENRLVGRGSASSRPSMHTFRSATSSSTTSKETIPASAVKTDACWRRVGEGSENNFPFATELKQKAGEAAETCVIDDVEREAKLCKEHAANDEEMLKIKCRSKLTSKFPYPPVPEHVGKGRRMLVSAPAPQRGANGSRRSGVVTSDPPTVFLSEEKHSDVLQPRSVHPPSQVTSPSKGSAKNLVVSEEEAKENDVNGAQVCSYEYAKHAKGTVSAGKQASFADDADVPSLQQWLDRV